MQRCLALAAITLASCGGQTAPAGDGSRDTSVPADATTGGSSSSGDNGNVAAPNQAPLEIACRVWYRPATSKLEDVYTVKAGGGPGKRVELAGNVVEFSYDAYTLVVTAPQLGVVSRYAVSSPGPSFVGEHGFTGLVYLGDDLQYVCSTGSGPPAAEPAATPFRVRCEIELRNGTTVMTTDSYTMPVDTTNSTGEVGVAVQGQDDVEGRFLLVSLWKAPNDATRPTVRRLIQLARNAPITPLGTDGLLGGTTTVGGDVGANVKQTCRPY